MRRLIHSHPGVRFLQIRNAGYIAVQYSGGLRTSAPGLVVQGRLELVSWTVNPGDKLAIGSGRLV